MTKKNSFKNKQGQTIVALIDVPKGQGPFPAIILCHGFKGYKEQLHLKTLAQALASRGFIVLRPDFTDGVGESDGKLEDIKFSKELTDLRSAVDYLVKQKNVDPKRIGLAGHSLGGQLVVHYAPSDKRIKALVGLAGSYIRGNGMTSLERNALANAKESKKTGYFSVHSKRTGKTHPIKIGFYYDLLKHNTYNEAKKIKIPILLLTGTADSSVRAENSKKVYQVVKGPKELTLIKGAPHTWRGKDDPGGKFQRIINKKVVDWFSKNL